MKVKYHNLKHLKKEGVESELDFNLFGKSLQKAQYALGMLEGSQEKLKNPSLLVSPLMVKEATISSKIEGTQSTVSDVYLYDVKGEGTLDTKQVSNYRKAMRFAFKDLREGRKLSPHLIETIHQILLEGVRHKGQIGRFRNELVWIGERDGDPIEKALFVPIAPESVRSSVENLLDYTEKSSDSTLIKTGLFHYQFESIHPFIDGNGRVGRLMIPLIMSLQKKLSLPILYISGYLEKHRDEYIQALHEVDKTGKYEPWLDFYFNAVSKQLEETQLLVNKIWNQYVYIQDKYKENKSPYIGRFIDFIFESPFFTIQDIQKELKISAWLTASSLIKTLMKDKYIEKTDLKDGKSKIYAFPSLLKLLA